MKETTIMNTNWILYILTLCILWVCPTACSETEWATPDETSIGIRFQIQGIDTRITYDNETSRFEENEVIGCVIATRDDNGNYQYLSNSQWHYASGVLVLDNDGYSGNILKQKTDGSEDGFLTITGNDVYHFFFYYPYVTLDLVKNDITSAIQQYNANNSIDLYKYLTYPHCATNTGLTVQINEYNSINLPPNGDQSDWQFIKYYQTFTTCGEVANSSNSDNLEYTWTTFPCFVNYYQGTSKAANHSDFLWCRYTGGINKNSNNAINLEFLKKTATIEVISDIGLTEIYFQCPKEQTLLRGKQINLQTGELSDYTYNANGSTQEKQMYMSTSNIIHPLQTSDTESGRHDYRLMLPAQSGFQCDMHFKLQGNDVLYNISLDDNINELKPGGRYIIHINPKGESTLEIVDWEDEHFEILTPGIQ